MTTAQEAFSEIRDCLNSSAPLQVRYAGLYALLRRLCSERAESYHSEFSGPFSLLYAVCRKEKIELRDADRFRRNARLVLWGRQSATVSGFHEDAACLCAFVCALFRCPLPGGLPQMNSGRPEMRPLPVERSAALRGIVTEVLPDGLKCRVGERELVVRLPGLVRTLAVAETGMTVNLLDVSETPEGATARMAVLDPDYLLDVSALTACVKPYGASPLNYLLDMLAPREVTVPILLGNAANGFMDDCMNGTPTFAEALRRNFGNDMLGYACCTEEISSGYVERARRQFDNIRTAVSERFPSPEVGIRPGEVLLEPSFVCEKLGLRGRFDVLTTDHRRLVELKSGKAEGFGGRPLRPKPEHVLQMSLYKEILHYNLGIPRDAVSSYLFYSAYPVFFNERTSAQAISDVLELRNEIVALEADLRRGGFDALLPRLTPDALNLKRLDNRLYRDYLRPALVRLLAPLHRMSDTERAYFGAFLRFVEREKYLSKTGDNRSDSRRGFASTWLTDPLTKRMSGDILCDLRLRSCEGEDGIDTLVFDVPDHGDRFVPNFNVGEMVQLYERPTERDTVTGHRLVRGYIEELAAGRLRLRLAYKQRNRSLFPLGTRYAVEHDASDAPFAQSLRGLYALMAAPEDRRALLLGLRPPGTDRSVSLLGTYPASTAKVVLQAKQARDYFLLVGPPGTGKTSVALRAMVEEFLLMRQAGTAGGSLLLTAYTHRAVDEICGMLERLGADYLRIGMAQNCGEAYRPRLLSERTADCPTRAAARTLLSSVPVIVGTVTTLSAHQEMFNLCTFDAVIVDEASQVLEPQIVGLLSASRDGSCCIRKFIMIGDHKQLPAVVLQRPERTRVEDPLLRAIGLLDLRDSLFERLHRLQAGGDAEGIVAMLDRQGRMHTDICGFVSRTFYDGRLDVVGLPHQTGPLPFGHPVTPIERFVASTRMGVVNVVPEGPADNNKANAAEADMTAALVEAIVRLNDGEGDAFRPEERIGVIVPFRNQIGMIRGALERRGVRGCDAIGIDTVECYQGSQRDYIIFSTTVSRHYQLDILSNTHDIGGVPIDRKLNVAITRARLQFLLVGHVGLLSCNPVYAAFLSACDVFDPAASR